MVCGTASVPKSGVLSAFDLELGSASAKQLLFLQGKPLHEPSSIVQAFILPQALAEGYKGHCFLATA